MMLKIAFVLVLALSSTLALSAQKTEMNRQDEKKTMVDSVRDNPTVTTKGVTTATSTGEYYMAKNEQTSKRVASNASKILSNPKSSKAAKSVAGSALTQTPNKKKKK